MLTKYLVLCSIFVLARGVLYKYVTEDSVLELTCTYDNECAADDIIIQAEEGYKVLITLKSVDIDGGSGDFLLVKSGTTLDDDYTGLIFTYHINEEKECLSLTENILLHFVINGSNEDSRTGFTLTAEHYGDQVTTAAPTTTGIPWPTTSDDELPYITVNMTITDFNEDIIDIFINIIVEMATEYVASHTDFELAEEISTENVHMYKIIQCPMSWPNMETCYQITFAVPLLLAEDSDDYGTYQLNTTHLLTMWDNATQYFGDSSNSIFYPYELPDNTRVITIWVSIICSVTVIFGVVYLVSGYQYSGYSIKKKKRGLLNQQYDNMSDDKRTSAASLTPHPLQTVPPLFDSSMPYFEPDSPPFLRSSGLDNTNDLREHDGQFIFDGPSLRGTSDT